METTINNKISIKVARFFYVVFFFLSFISHTLQEEGLHIIFSRVTPADIAALIALIFTIPSFINFFKACREIPKVYIYSGVLITGFFLTTIFSLFPLRTLVECIIVLFLLFISIGVYLSFRDRPLLKILSVFMWGAIVFTCIGFYDLIAEQYGFSRIFPVAKYPGVMISGFKNTGQAGSFFMIIFILLLPLRFSKTAKYLKQKQIWLLNIALACCVLMLFTLGKYAVIFGMTAGVTLFIIYIRKIKILYYALGVIIFLVLFFSTIKVALPYTYDRIVFKFEQRVIGNEMLTSETGFIESNFALAIRSFKEHPLTGCGLGSFQCHYSYYEVHSTYLKVLGETGLIGVILYLLFMFYFLKQFPISWKPKIDPLKHYLQCLLPLLLGALISWIYTYHLRKREFWILIAVVMIISFKMIKYKDKSLDDIKW